MRWEGMKTLYRMAGNFGGECILADLRAIHKYFHPPNCCHRNVVHRRSKCLHKSFIIRKNGMKTFSWFQRSSICYGSKWIQQYTLLTAPVCSASLFCYEYNYGIRLTQLPKYNPPIAIIEQSAKYSSRQNFRAYGVTQICFCM